ADVTASAESFLDYGRKWQECRLLYRDSTVLPRLPLPGMFLMGWRAYIDPQGRVAVDGESIRKALAAVYSRPDVHLYHLPVVAGAYLYNDCSVELMHSVEGD